jgi:hypothetical protein
MAGDGRDRRRGVAVLDEQFTGALDDPAAGFEGLGGAQRRAVRAGRVDGTPLST